MPSSLGVHPSTCDVCVVCVVCLVLCVWWGGGGWERWDGEGEGWGGGGGIDNGGWVLDPMCCNVFHIGCQKYTHGHIRPWDVNNIADIMGQIGVCVRGIVVHLCFEKNRWFNGEF